jgi:eukaryotic-like serine/threonine-protein kinase
MANTALIDLVGRVLARRYRLLSPVGAGASGRVYLADDIRLRRRVAVKVLHSALSDDAGFLRGFRAEAQMAAALHHPNVMAVYDWGEDDGVPFMVLELLRGGSLRGLLDTGARLTPEQSTHVGRQVAAALNYAHTRGIVHRDIKPANLLFDEHGIVRVADFGLARALAEASWTEPSGAVIGTARYAAPEQGSQSALDGRSDLYSLALVLVEACTGSVPVMAETAIATLAARTVRPVEAPAELGPLGPVLARAGRPARAERYRDAAAMGTALARVARQLPRPEPLVLAGLGDEVEDVEPTRLGHATHARNGDVDAADAPTVDKAFPLEIIPESRHAIMRRSAIPIVVAIAVTAALIGALVLIFSARSGATVPAPSLVGLDRAGAAAEATNAGLLMRVVERRTADDPAGLILEQHPSPGAFLGEGEEVEVIVSRGPPPVVLPDVTGKPVAEATVALQELGFVVAVEPRFDENVPKDIALGTEPVAGQKASPESTIKLVVSAGPAPVAVPEVAGKSYEEAVDILSASRLGASRRDDFSDSVAPGVVIGTEPGAGKPAARDSAVTVIVSKGPQLVQVPNLVGMTVEAASSKLSSLGLVPDVENYGPGKQVRAQDPTGGAMAKKGASVTLFL